MFSMLFSVISGHKTIHNPLQEQNGCEQQVGLQM